MSNQTIPRNQGYLENNSPQGKNLFENAMEVFMNVLSLVTPISKYTVKFHLVWFTEKWVSKDYRRLTSDCRVKRTDCKTMQSRRWKQNFFFKVANPSVPFECVWDQNTLVSAWLKVVCMVMLQLLSYQFGSLTTMQPKQLGLILWRKSTWFKNRWKAMPWAISPCARRYSLASLKDNMQWRFSNYLAFPLFDGLLL